MRGVYVPMLTHRYSPPIVVVAFLIGVSVLGSYGVRNVGKNFNAFDYLPDGSELRQFIKVERGYFGNIIDLDFLFDAPSLNNPDNIASLCTLDRRLDDLDFVVRSDLMPFWGGIYANYYGHVCVASAAQEAGWNCSASTPPPPLGNSSHDCFREWVTVMSLFDGGRITENFRFGQLTPSGHLPITAAK